MSGLLQQQFQEKHDKLRVQNFFHSTHLRLESRARVAENTEILLHLLSLILTPSIISVSEASVLT